MPKSQRLLLDANVIIYAHELRVWSQLIEKCDITITLTVKEQETYYWRDQTGIPYPIDIDVYINEGKINCVCVPLKHVDSFKNLFGPHYLDRMDPGESDSLAFLYYSSDEHHICSSDGIVFRILGALAMADRGISLEEVLQQKGLTRSIDQQYTKAYRLSLTDKGQAEGITGMALKPEVESEKDK